MAGDSLFVKFPFCLLLCLAFVAFEAAQFGCASCWQRTVGEEVVAARQLSLKGLDLMQRGQWEEAEKVFSQAVATCPTDDRARRWYAETLLHRGAEGEAISQLSEAVRLSENDAELSVRLGEIRLSRGEHQLARRRAEAAIRSQQDLPSAWALLGHVQQAQGQPKEALTSFHRALSYEPDNVETQFAAACVYRNLNRPHRALAMLSALKIQYAASQPPQHVLIEESLALEALGRFDEAAATLATLTERDESSAEIYFHLSRMQMEAGDLSNARLSIRQALQRAPDDPPILSLLAELEERQQSMALMTR